MPKRPDSLETLRLALQLLDCIPKRSSITATKLRQKLADEGHVRESRTIQRLLETLCDFDLFGIERDSSSKPYRCAWKENAEGFTLRGLTTQESLLLTLAQQQLSNQLPARLKKSMDGLFSQALSQLGDSANAQRERKWLYKVPVARTTQPLLPPKVIPDVFQQVGNALYDNKWLHVVYQNANGKKVGPTVSCRLAWRSKALACIWPAALKATTTTAALRCIASDRPRHQPCRLCAPKMLT